MGRRVVRITVDTNVLVRMIVQDDEAQAATARALLLQATVIAVPIPVLCEVAWVLGRGYGYGADEVAAAIRAITGIDTVVTDAPAAEAGLAALCAGGDFADGAIASQGERLGGAVFASFDRSAVAMLRQHGAGAADPGELIAEAAPGA